MSVAKKKLDRSLPKTARDHLAKIHHSRESASHEAQHKAILLKAAGLASRCTKDGGFRHEFQPHKPGETLANWTKRFDWHEYGVAWTEKLILPLVQQLEVLENDLGIKALDVVCIQDRKDPAGRAARWSFMRGQVERLVRAKRKAQIALSVGRAIGVVLVGDRDYWDHYHSYFDSIVAQLRRMTRRRPATRRHDSSSASRSKLPTDRQEILDGGELEDPRVQDLPDAPRNAYRGYLNAQESSSSIKTDQDAYRLLKKVVDDMPSFSTWSRALRRAREKLGIQKRRPGQLPVTRSVRSAAELDRGRSDD